MVNAAESIIKVNRGAIRPFATGLDCGGVEVSRIWKYSDEDRRGEGR